MLRITGMGHAHPPGSISNKFLVDLETGTDEEWIAKYIGILERRTVLPLAYIQETKNADPRRALEVASHTPTDLGEQAARVALERAGLQAGDIGLVIGNCCAPVETTPSEAQRIAKRLDIPAKAFDVFTACPAFALHLDLLTGMRDERLPDHTLCVSTACLTTTVDYSDRTDGAIWGDGAAAWIVSKEGAGARIISTSYATDPKRCEAVVVDRQGYFHQDGRAVRHFSVAQTVRLLRALEKTQEIDWSQTYFVGHQANKAMLDSVCRNRGIDESRHLSNVVHIGNQAGAGAPATISMNWDRMASGDHVAVAVVGAGLSWGSVFLAFD
ncbi:MAG: 3-oxoacyl-ACP synthase III family protein [Planctomycetota bacterium]|jgi:3-oxoacyl-[acyl-carrier-protein] synthase-3